MRTRVRHCEPLANPPRWLKLWAPAPGKEGGLRQLEQRVALVWTVLQAFAETTQDYQQLLTLVAVRVADLLQNTCTVRLLAPDRLTLEPAAVYATDPAVKAEIESLVSKQPIVVAERDRSWRNRHGRAHSACRDLLVTQRSPASSSHCELAPDQSGRARQWSRRSTTG